MHTALVLRTALSSVLLFAAGVSHGSALRQLENEVVDLVRGVTPQVVTVQALFPEAATGSGPGGVVNVGTGLVIDSLGHIITSGSVVRHAGAIAPIISVVDHEFRTHEAIVFGIDRAMGVTILLSNTLRVPTALRLRSDEWEVGRLAVVVGNSAGVMPTASLTNVAGRRERDEFWQLAHPATPGCSGAPVFDVDGTLGGMIVGEMATLGAERGGRALPAVMISSHPLASILHRFILASTPGRRPYLGIMASPGLHADGRMSIHVTNVVRDSPAAVAGIRSGDVLLTVDSLRMSYLADLSDWLQRSTPGKVARMRVLRDGRSRAFTVTIGRR